MWSVSSVQFSHSVVSDSFRPDELQHTRLPCPSVLPDSWSLVQLMSIESVMPSNHLILYHLLLLMPSIFPSTGVPFNKLAFCIRWSKYLSFSFSISASSEYSGLISLKIDWFDLLAVLETLKNLYSTTIWKHQFLGAQPSSWSNSHIHTWLLEKP